MLIPALETLDHYKQALDSDECEDERRWGRNNYHASATSSQHVLMTQAKINPFITQLEIY